MRFKVSAPLPGGPARDLRCQQERSRAGTLRRQPSAPDLVSLVSSASCFKSSHDSLMRLMRSSFGVSARPARVGAPSSSGRPAGMVPGAGELQARSWRSLRTGPPWIAEPSRTSRQVSQPSRSCCDASLEMRLKCPGRDRDFSSIPSVSHQPGHLSRSLGPGSLWRGPWPTLAIPEIALPD